MFEYKVRCRHKLGWKEFKLYADTDIEEFFNRNSIDYVRNITDTVENRQLQEIERLNNIINELKEYKYAIYKIKQYINSYNPYFIDTQEDNNKKIANIINEIGKKKLKDSD